MIVGPVQRECICDPWMRRHGEHGPECAKAYKAKLLGRKDDVRALHAEGHPLTPGCQTCHGNAVVTVPVGPRDRDGNRHTEEAPCPACSAGDDEAVARIGLPEFDALSRAALAPAPVSREDYLNTLVEDALTDENPDFPNPPSPCSEPVRNRTSLLHDDADGRGGQASPSAADPSLVPARSLPGAQATMTSEDPASASPGRRSNLQGRAA